MGARSSGLGRVGALACSWDYRKGLFSIFTLITMHLVYPLPPPPKKKKKKFAIVFELSWDDCNTQEKIGNNAYAKFWWINRLHNGLYENGEFSFSNKGRVFKMCS